MSQTALTIQEPATDAIAIVEKIASKNPGEQLEASKAIESGEPVYFEALLQVLERENRKKSRRFGLALTFMIACIATFQLLLYFAFDVKGGGQIGGLFVAGLGIAARFAPTRLQREAARKVAESDDMRAVGPLAESLDKQDSSTKKTAASALTRLLPRLKHSDFDLLNEEQRKCLLTGFTSIKDQDFKLAVLKSLSQVGDERFLKAVRSMSEGKGAAKKDAELRTHAAETLDALKDRIEQDKSRFSLLHPVESPAGQADILLRPAGSSPSDPQHLLRASDATEPAG